MAAGVPVQDGGNFLWLGYNTGSNFGGITASPAAQFGTVGVLNKAEVLYGVAKFDPNQAIVQGQPLFAMNGGLMGGMDQDGAVGVASIASAPGTATVTVDLFPGANAGSTGTKTGAVGAGTTQATAYVITAPSTQFSTVAAGSGAILGVIPIGKSIFIANDGANALLVYPQSGGQIGTAVANASVSIAAGTSATFRRLSITLWHQ